MQQKPTQDSGIAEDLHGAQGRVFHVNRDRQCFELLKETVFDPKTHEGRSRHTVYWTDQTRFVKVVTQNSFAGIDQPVMARFSNLDEENAKAAADGKPFVVMQATILTAPEEAQAPTDDHRDPAGRFTADPTAPNARAGTVELDGRQVAVRLRGPRAQVSIRTTANAEDLAEGFWEAKLTGRRHADRFVVDAMEIYPLVDPRTIDDPSLPRVLIIGDSISMNYYAAAKAELKGIANVHRIDGNGGPSDRGVACMELWLGDYTQKGLQWDLIQFNHGLHDLKQPYDGEADRWGEHQVSIEEYKRNLDREIRILKKTGAILAWCTTTPVPNSSLAGIARRKDEDLVFNQAALEVMGRYPDIRVHDLNSFIRESSAFDEWRKGTDVHFWGQKEQELVGREVAKAIRAALSAPRNPEM